MRWKRHTPEEIATKLQRAHELIARGVSIGEAAKSIGVTEPTYFRWRRDFGGLKLDQIQRIKQLEAENARLRRAISDLDLAPPLRS